MKSHRREPTLVFWGIFQCLLIVGWRCNAYSSTWLSTGRPGPFRSFHSLAPRQRRRGVVQQPSYAFALQSSRDTSTITTSAGNDEDENDTRTFLLPPEQVDCINTLVEERSQARWDGNYTLADILRQQIQNISLSPLVGYQIVVTDIPRKNGGGSAWKLVQDQPSSFASSVEEGPTVLQLAHAALGVAVESSIQFNLRRSRDALGIPSQNAEEEEEGSSKDANNDNKKSLDDIVQQAKRRLLNNDQQVQYELSGRKSADAAFWFAIAGVSDSDLYTRLTEIATKELERFGERSSCRTKDVYQILERFAAAGVSENGKEGENDDESASQASKLAKVAERVLRQKRHSTSSATIVTTSSNQSDDDDNLLDLHSNRSLLLIWKFSTKQKKQKAFLRSAHRHWERLKQKPNDLEIPTPQLPDSTKRSRSHVVPNTPHRQYDWSAVFADDSRPLVIDVGCGMGVSLLGLAKSGFLGDADDDNKEHILSSNILLDSGLRWSDCNFAGVDLGALGIGYANGIATRLGLGDRLQFFVDSAEDFVDIVRATYPGPVAFSLVQFPTPFRLKKQDDADDGDDERGNTQLPSSARDGFMVSENLLRSLQRTLAPHQGKLLLQSNCEDVAVWMRNLACTSCNFDFVTLPKDDDSSALLVHMKAEVTPRQPQRTLDWIAMGGERAFGPGWLTSPVLHREAATETEVACGLNGTPVHRCLLRIR